MAFNFLKKLIGVDSQEENIKYSDLRTNPSNQSGNDCTGVLNLKKNDVLDLTKRNPSLNNLVLGAGWDSSRIGANIDLDLIAFLLDSNGKLVKSDKISFIMELKRQKVYF